MMIEIRYHFLDARSLPSKADLAELNSLLKQLSEKARVVDWGIVWDLASTSRLLVARNTAAQGNGGKSIVGMATLVIGHKPTARYGHIEDVVVDEAYRHQGIGRKLTEALLEEGRKAELMYIELTSNPQRTAANEMYIALGFLQRDTNVYRLVL